MRYREYREVKHFVSKQFFDVEINTGNLGRFPSYFISKFLSKISIDGKIGCYVGYDIGSYM